MHQLGIHSVFVDLKYHNTPGVVAAAVNNISRLNVGMINVHCSGGIKMMSAAKQAAKNAALESKGKIRDPLVIWVTILTSLDYEDLVALGIFPNVLFSDPKQVPDYRREKMEKLIISLALAALKAGLVRQRIREGNPTQPVNFAPFLATLVHRSSESTFEGSPIIYLVHYDIATWAPEDCPLCKQGSKRLRPKHAAEWTELTGKK